MEAWIDMLKLPSGSRVQGRRPRTRIRRLESLDRCAKTSRYAEPAVAGASVRYICKEHGFEGLETWIDMLKPLGEETVVRTVGEEDELIDSEAWIEMLKPPGRGPRSETSTKGTNVRAWKPGLIC